MDYGKSGNANLGKAAPAGIPSKGAPTVAYGQSADTKAALLARMKAAAEARKAKQSGS